MKQEGPLYASIHEGACSIHYPRCISSAYLFGWTCFVICSVLELCVLLSSHLPSRFLCCAITCVCVCVCLSVCMCVCVCECVCTCVCVCYVCRNPNGKK